MKKIVSESLYEFNENFIIEKELLKGQITPLITYDDVDKKEFLLGLAVEKTHSTNLAAQKLLVLQNLNNNDKFYSENVKRGIYKDPHTLNLYKKYFIDKEDVSEIE